MHETKTSGTRLPGRGHIPSLPSDAARDAERPYREMLDQLPTVLDAARDSASRHGDAFAFACGTHALRHSDPAVVCQLGAAALVQLAKHGT
jgi:hypothetical protein